MTKTSALKSEATDLSESVTFEYKGDSYEIERDISVDVTECLEQGQVVGATKALLGDEQYQTFKKLKPKMSDLNDLLQAAFESLGVDLGK